MAEIVTSDSVYQQGLIAITLADFGENRSVPDPLPPEPRSRGSLSMSNNDLGLLLKQVALPSGWRVVYEPMVGSTMELAREAARGGWPDRTVFACDFQTAGRGREGRRWEAPPGTALLFTILLRSVDPPWLATMTASVALCEAIEHLVHLEPVIKWPNDLLLREEKLAGVLAESYSGQSEAYVLVGCGVNVNQEAQAFRALNRSATSLRLRAGRSIHRGELLALCLERFETWLSIPSDERATWLRQGWEARLWGRSRRVRLRDGGCEFNAVIEGVGPDGSLVVRLDDGRSRHIIAGEIII